MEGFSGQMPFLLLMLVVFFFFIILPQQRRQKKEKNFMKNLSKGDRVITKSGIHAKVVELNPVCLGTFVGSLEHPQQYQHQPSQELWRCLGFLP